jgi:energy-coupling factor transporter ATP-binding protein EcfA2
MYIDSVQLTNIRGFRNLDFSFKRSDGSYAGWTVFTGDNGSGKSTLLKAIALALTGKDTARSLVPDFRGWITDGEHQAAIQLQLVRVTEDDSLAEGGNAPSSKPFPAQIALTNGGREPSVEVALPRGISRRNYSTPHRTIWSPDAHAWFSCGYGPFRRVFGASPEATRQMVAPSTERFVTMFQEAASLAEVDQWLRNLHHKSLEKRTDEREQLRILVELLRDDLMPNQIVVDRVDSDGLWLRDRNGVQLTWSAMSDGYRAALALLADILRHLFNAYGLDIVEQSAEGTLVVQRSGVVLIDEIDAHLHPEWQRLIGFWLTRHFPKIQFLVTTHSPIICQAASSNGLFVLPEPGSDDQPRPLSEEERQRIIASRPDTILLTPAFGLQNTRSPAAEDARAAHAALRSKERAGGKLSREEKARFEQTKLFVLNGEDD